MIKSERGGFFCLLQVFSLFHKSSAGAAVCKLWQADCRVGEAGAGKQKKASYEELAFVTTAGFKPATS